MRATISLNEGDGTYQLTRQARRNDFDVDATERKRRKSAKHFTHEICY
jgi:hypothetical protein